MAQVKAEPTVDAARRRALTDLGFVIGVFLLCSAAEPWLEPVLRRGHDLPGVFALAGYQFACEGFALVVVLVMRRETPADYGFRGPNLGRSIALGVGLAFVNNLALSWHSRTLLWLPFARHTAARMSVSAGAPAAVLGIGLTIAVWGLVESFFGVFFARRVNTILRHAHRGWLSPGALSFAAFNGLIHLAIGQGAAGFVTSFASGYAIGVIPAVVGNAWGSAVFQVLTNAVGHG